MNESKRLEEQREKYANMTLDGFKQLADNSFKSLKKAPQVAGELKDSIPAPSCGRIVHYQPVLPDCLKRDNPAYVKQLPGIVVEASDLYVNMVVFSMGSSPSQSCISVPHKSVAAENQSYWEWPKIN